MSKIKLFNGLSIAFQQFACTNKQLNLGPVLCLHGWLDNSNSFSYLGPALSEKGYDVVAIDFISHGRSDHHNDDSPHFNLARVQEINGVFDAFGWDTEVNLIGHSMGAGVSMLFAGVFPQKVKKLVLIDGFGPFTKPAEQSCMLLRKALESETKFYFNKRSTPKLYSTLEAAIQTRIRNVASYPGEQKLSYEAASSIVRRY